MYHFFTEDKLIYNLLKYKTRIEKNSTLGVVQNALKLEKTKTTRLFGWVNEFITNAKREKYSHGSLQE